MTTQSKIHVPDGMKLIFRRFRTCPKTGKQLDARTFGIKAWPILVSA